MRGTVATGIEPIYSASKADMLTITSSDQAKNFLLKILNKFLVIFIWYQMFNTPSRTRTESCSSLNAMCIPFPPRGLRGREEN